MESNNRIAIMQPYFLPYLGYFQLISAVDIFVIYDDVNYIKGGWVNRNRILLNGEAFMINVPMRGASSFKKINEIQIGENKFKLLPTISQAYKNAPFYNDVFPLIFEIIHFDTDNLACFISNSIIKIVKYLQINTAIILSSEMRKNNDLKGQDKILSICHILSTSKYYNVIAGIDLYNKKEFADHNIELKFLKTNLVSYKQYRNEFVPWLSVLDVMMFNSPAEITNMLENYELI